jgi:hypothetical protein
MSLADLKYHRQIAKKEPRITPKSFQPRFNQASRIDTDRADIGRIRALWGSTSAINGQSVRAMIEF